MILLAYSRLGGLAGFARQSAIFLVLLFASFAGKKQHQTNVSRGPAAPAAPAGELASSISSKGEAWHDPQRTGLVLRTGIGMKGWSIRYCGVFMKAMPAPEVGARLSRSRRRHCGRY